ncbi:MAG TPA: monodechloroaminopyrrolnitrin synthase PrnB family protein [Streptomyces sp.]|nr:monodechloroaminopyrrolnitrin synthase PrnB family protein [Streptomyces sp.]
MPLTHDPDATVAALDPLDADAVMRALPHANLAADVTWLHQRAALLARRSAEVLSAAPAQAALRDLGMLTASLARHTRHSAPAPCVEAALLRLGALTGEVPRETVYSYTTRNPRGPRRRSFTDTPGEHLFIDEVTAASHTLEAAIDLLVHLPEADNETAATALADQVAQHLRAFSTHLLRVKRNLTPEFFTGQLRPYYPPLEIAGRTYYAPGGAQMPLLVVDVLLLAQASTGPLARWYAQYVAGNVLYLPPHHRALIEDAGSRPGLARLARHAAHLRPAALRLLGELRRFRLPHRELARTNMAVRPDGSLGSGGYTTHALDRLLDVTESARALLTPGSPV